MSKLKDEDLIKVILDGKSRERSKNAKKRTTVEHFIEDYGIRENLNCTVPIHHIYWVYHKWCEINKKKAQNYRLFSIEFNKKFKRYKSTYYNAYYIDNSKFQISPTEWLQMRQFMRKHKMTRSKHDKEKKK